MTELEQQHKTITLGRPAAPGRRGADHDRARLPAGDDRRQASRRRRSRATSTSRSSSVTPGEAVMAATPDESHYNPIGSVHGGFVATLLDSVCGCAVQTTLPVGTAYTSLDLSVSFLRGMTTETGRVIATGRVTKPGIAGGIRRGRHPRCRRSPARHGDVDLPGVHALRRPAMRSNMRFSSYRIDPWSPSPSSRSARSVRAPSTRRWRCTSRGVRPTSTTSARTTGSCTTTPSS